MCTDPCVGLGDDQWDLGRGGGGVFTGVHEVAGSSVIAALQCMIQKALACRIQHVDVHMAAAHEQLYDLEMSCSLTPHRSGEGGGGGVTITDGWGMAAILL